MTPGISEMPSVEPRSWLRRWWWLWLSLSWVVVGLLFAGQTVWLGGFSWGAAIGWAVLDWGSWVPLAPVVVWLAHRLQINSVTWRWAVPAHIGLAIFFAAAIELASVLAFQRGWMPDPRPGPRVAGQEFGPQRPPVPAGFGPASAPAPKGDAKALPPPDRADRTGEFRRAPEGEFRPGPGGELRGPRPVGEEPRRRMPVGTGRGRLALPIYFVLVAGAHAVAYHRRSLERERRALQAEARLAEARALALQNQLQPHFFFNSLNTVASLVYTQPEQAEETICALGELMRGVLDAAHRREIPLREELAFVDRYLAVQQIRFGARLQVRREIADATLACAVPTLLLQPLVENAVVHGIAPLAAGGTVEITARRAGARLVLTVANTCGADAGALPVGPAVFKERIGIANTRARLEALYGAEFKFGHRRREDGGVVAEVELPWKWSEA